MEFIPYEHQKKALNDLWEAMQRDNVNPCCCVPTGGGKTIIAGYLASAYRKLFPEKRIVILAHVGELVKQNQETVEAICNEPVGIYCSSVQGRKDVDQNIICASIQSIFKRTTIGSKTSPKCGQFDLIIVDEAHRIPDDSETMYRTFLYEQGWLEGGVGGPKIVGLSATPYRLGTGKIYGLGRLFTELAHNMSVLELIDKGILCAPVSQRGAVKTNFSKTKTNRGEFDANSIAETMHPNLPFIAKEIVEKAGERKKWILFTANIKQAEDIAQLLRDQNVSAETIHSKMPKKDRDQVIADFRNGKFKALANVNCLTEGFDVKDIDLVALVRPTKSTSLYVQMVGRGLRTHPNKEDVLILDFGQNVSRHGPIDLPFVRAEQEEGKKKKGMPGKHCPECGFGPMPIATAICTECGHAFPKPQSKLQTKASLLGVLSKPMWFQVVSVTCTDYRSIYTGKYSLRVTYTICDPDDPSTKMDVSEFLPFNHSSDYAKKKCANFWTMRGGKFPIPDNPKSAMDRIGELTEKPVMIQIKRSQNGKHIEVGKVKFKTQPIEQKEVA